MEPDNRQHYQFDANREDSWWEWWAYHSVTFDHNERMIYIVSLSARLCWRFPFAKESRP